MSRMVAFQKNHQDCRGCRICLQSFEQQRNAWAYLSLPLSNYMQYHQSRPFLLFCTLLFALHVASLENPGREQEAVQCCLLIIRKLHIPNYHMPGIELSCHLGLKVSSSVSESWTQIARPVSLEQISDWSCSLLVHFQSCDYTSPYLLDN